MAAIPKTQISDTRDVVWFQGPHRSIFGAAILAQGMPRKRKKPIQTRKRKNHASLLRRVVQCEANRRRLSSRMMLRMHFLHARTCNMCVYLCSRQIAVTQQHLYDTEVGTIVKQMGRKRVPQSMR